jgi:hypothetical protein
MRLLALPTSRFPLPTFPRVASGVQGVKSFRPGPRPRTPWALGPVSTGRRLLRVGLRHRRPGLPCRHSGRYPRPCLDPSPFSERRSSTSISCADSGGWLSLFRRCLACRWRHFRQTRKKGNARVGECRQRRGDRLNRRTALHGPPAQVQHPHSSFDSRSAMGVKTQARPTLRLVKRPRA